MAEAEGFAARPADLRRRDVLGQERGREALRVGPVAVDKLLKLGDQPFFLRQPHRVNGDRVHELHVVGVPRRGRGRAGARLLGDGKLGAEASGVDRRVPGRPGGLRGLAASREVTAAGVRKEPEGRADDATLWLKDLGDTVYYGG